LLSLTLLAELPSMFLSGSTILAWQPFGALPLCWVLLMAGFTLPRVPELQAFQLRISKWQLFTRAENKGKLRQPVFACMWRRNWLILFILDHTPPFWKRVEGAPYRALGRGP
jgi:hypothetical protein